MIWRVLFTPKAERDLKSLQKPEEQRIKDELTALAEEAHPRLHVKQKGNQNIPAYSYRIGRFRIILTIEDDMMVIFVIEIGDRSIVYRKY
ncbi:plasmid stabilization protein [Methanocalculus chunghsingensis]|uniref:Plasmid stabilization protein n=1 Tax=Methanocalculus chunghsingensis TaxID=156457 RepID=A0A8J7W5X7_9EURY|nr:type II toxin-antitoxin system RelE/ParE family toxin [Methanocalculus chunghsingensis]MBR1368153.1 plasmid stabilization protein [Methanocalculus chunghsingensis]